MGIGLYNQLVESNQHWKASFEDALISLFHFLINKADKAKLVL